MELKVEYIPITELKPYERNAKKHPADQVEHIANSIKEFGFRQPIVADKDGVVIIGHGRLEAAKKLKLDTVPVVYADDLSEEQIKALRLADNKTNESEWDLDFLDLELSDITDINMEDFGFDLAFDDEPESVLEDDYDGELPEEPKSKVGDIYQLGQHRVICGDCTDINVIHRKAYCCELDPRYVDAIIDRFEKFTGQKAVLLNG